ncbi:MAG: hypothetical protein HOY79_17510 [Streptomyces sp.]|nr:hypothetical protein [Streptomyces sp.]
MPIKPENRALYPANWQAISKRIRFDRGAGQCECDGRCGAVPHDDERCTAVHGQPHPHTGSKVVLTTAHLDHDPGNCDDANLMGACQRCHLNYDKEHHANSRRASKAAAGTGGGCNV